MGPIVLAFISATITVFGCQLPVPSTEKEVEKSSAIEAATTCLPSLSDAEKILGETASLTDSSSYIKDGVVTCNSTFTAHKNDPETGRKVAVYYMFEQYQLEDAAKTTYASIYTSNAGHEGVQVLKDLGDEAYFHSDGSNFLFIMVRKGAKMFRIKVNKMTGKTSTDAFYEVAGKLTAMLK